MIIVSQDKTRLINFERVEILGIDLKNNKQICCGFNQGNIVLGKYATEERANEVLQNIYSAYKCIKILENPNIRIKEVIVEGKDLGNCLVYEMPED